MNGCVDGIIWHGSEVEIVYREEAGADPPDDVPASCYNRQTTTQVLSYINFDTI